MVTLSDIQLVSNLGTIFMWWFLLLGSYLMIFLAVAMPIYILWHKLTWIFRL